MVAILFFFKVSLFTKVIKLLIYTNYLQNNFNSKYTNLQFWLFTNPAITLIAKPVLDHYFESCNFLAMLLSGH